MPRFLVLSENQPPSPTDFTLSTLRNVSRLTEIATQARIEWSAQLKEQSAIVYGAVVDLSLAVRMCQAYDEYTSTAQHAVDVEGTSTSVDADENIVTELGLTGYDELAKVGLVCRSPWRLASLRLLHATVGEAQVNGSFNPPLHARHAFGDNAWRAVLCGWVILVAFLCLGWSLVTSRRSQRKLILLHKKFL